MIEYLIFEISAHDVQELISVAANKVCTERSLLDNTVENFQNLRTASTSTKKHVAQVSWKRINSVAFRATAKALAPWSPILLFWRAREVIDQLAL